MRSFPETAKKSAIVGALCGLAIVSLLIVRGADQSVVDHIKTYLGWPIEALQSIAEKLGYGKSVTSFHDWLLGAGLPFTAGMVGAIKSSIVLADPIHLLGRPPVDFIWPSAPVILDTQLDRADVDLDDPRNADIPFQERSGELSRLRRFLAEPVDESTYMVVSGREGIGKSRLAIECLRFAHQHGWDAGILRNGVTAQEIDDCHFRRKTVILIDDATNIPELWDIIDAFLRKQKRLRILLTDQVGPDHGNVPRRDLVQRLDAAKRDGMRLEGLSLETLATLAPSLVHAARDQADGRPLFVLLGDNPLGEIKRRAALRLSKAANDSERSLLALAALAGPVPMNIPHGATNFFRVDNVKRLAVLFEGENPESLARTIPAVRPQPVADFLLLSYANDCTEAARSALIQAAIQRNAAATEKRLASLWSRKSLDVDEAAVRTDLQESFDAAAPHRVHALRSQMAESRIVTARSVTGGIDGQQNLAHLNDALFQVSQIADVRPFDREIRLQEAKAAVNAIGAFGESKRWTELERWSARLVSLVDSPFFCNDRDFRLEEAFAAANAIIVYGEAQRWADLERWGDRLTTLVDTPPFSTDPEIRLEEARASLNAINQYGEVQRWADLERWGARLTTLVDTPAFCNDREIRWLEGVAANRVVHHYGDAGLLADLERWAARITSLSETFADDYEFTLGAARTVGNTIDSYGRMQQWDGLERWGHRLATIKERHVSFEDTAIGLEDAVAAVRAMVCYGKAQRWADLERWGARLTTLVDTPPFSTDPEIRLEEARASLNSINQYGEFQRWADLERWGARLTTLVDTPAFRNDREIRFRESMAAVNAVARYGQAQQWADVERWGARLITLVESPRFSRDRYIRLEEALAANHAMFDYGAAQKWSDFERWGARIVALSETPPFRDDREMRLEEAKAAAKAIDFYGRAQNWEAVERWGARLIALSETLPFRDDREIRLLEAMTASNAIFYLGQAGASKSSQRSLWFGRLALVARCFRGSTQVQQLAAQAGVDYTQQFAMNWPYGKPTQV